MLPLIIVTGCNGQVGGEIKNLSDLYQNKYNFLFTTKYEFDLANPETIEAFFTKHKPNYFINCAAYTAVDKAESEVEAAKKINAIAVGLIAKHCASLSCWLIQVSTDYVFDGSKTTPYLPKDKPNPINVYGLSKLLGEELALQNNNKSIIVRTSWVYNKTGKNFVNTMRRLMQDKESISVVSDQIGCPTYAPNFAEALLKMVDALDANPNLPIKTIYHYCNNGIISWFDFAMAIKELLQSNCVVNPIPSSQYPTPAKRSTYSALDCKDIINDFRIEMHHWKKSLKECLS
jgi:dTDP-4-dehydrorhamnose reductase